MMSNLKLLLLAIIVFSLAACSAVGMHTPVVAVEPSSISDTSVNGPLALINAQQSDHQVDLQFRGILIRLRDSTQALVDGVERELKQRGATITDSADKRLSLSVTGIEMISGMNVYRAVIHFRVESGEGNVVEMSSTRASLASGYNLTSNPTKPIDVAMSDAVGMILNHAMVQAYLVK